MKYKTVMDGERFEHIAVKKLEKECGLLYISGVDHHDLMNDKFLVEVKSCKLLRKVKDNGSGNPGFHYGRFYIVKDNHDKMMAEARKTKKQAVYIFFVEHSDNYLYSIVSAEDVEVTRERENKTIASVFRWQD